MIAVNVFHERLQIILDNGSITMCVEFAEFANKSCASTRGESAADRNSFISTFGGRDNKLCLQPLSFTA